MPNMSARTVSELFTTVVTISNILEFIQTQAKIKSEFTCVLYIIYCVHAGTRSNKQFISIILVLTRGIIYSKEIDHCSSIILNSLMMEARKGNYNICRFMIIYILSGRSLRNWMNSDLTTIIIIVRTKLISAV